MQIGMRKKIALLLEAIARFAISVNPAKAGIQDALKNWIPGRAPLARNDDMLHLQDFCKSLIIYKNRRRRPSP
jgi:hypothetical protein